MSRPNGPQVSWERIRDVPLLTSVGLVVGATFLLLLLIATEGHFVPPVVDLYVVCQYAKAIAEGHAFHYNPGEAASTGATSLLHTSLLGAAHAVGIRGEGLIAFTILLGGALYVVSVLLAARIGRLTAGAREGLLAGGLVALGGPVVWGFFYGSDIALYMFLALALLERMLTDWPAGRPIGVALVGALIALTRPEGLALAVLLGAVWSFGPGRGARGWRRASPWLPFATALLVLVLNRVITGLWLGTSLADKSLVASYGVSTSLGLISQYLLDVARGILLGFFPPDASIGFSRGWGGAYFPPLALILILVALARARPEVQAPLRAWCAIVGVLFVLLSPNVYLGVHFNRYLMWAFPGLLAVTAVGLGSLTRLAARDDVHLEGLLFKSGAALALGLGLLSTVRFATLYADMAGEVYRRDVAAAGWIERNLPRGSRMANVATSIEYLTGHYNMNLHGVTSPFFFGNRPVEREANVFEALGRIPESERPPYLISSASAQESYATLREIVEQPPLYQTISFADEILIFRLRYDLVGRNARMFLPKTLEAVGGLREVDRLNVCDSRDEANHGYRFDSHVGNVSLNGSARIAAYELPAGREVVIDGGRAILGSERFFISTHANRDLLIVLRAAGDVDANVRRESGSGAYGVTFPEAGLILRLGSHAPLRTTFRPRRGWDEQILRVPASMITEGRTELVISGRYPSFFYWFFQ